MPNFGPAVTAELIEMVPLCVSEELMSIYTLNQDIEIFLMENPSKVI